MHRVTAGGAWAAHLLGTELYARAGVGNGVYHVTLHHQHGVSGATLGRCHLSGGPASQSDCARIGHTRAPSWYLGRRLTPDHQSLGTSHAGACNNACSVYAASRGACHGVAIHAVRVCKGREGSAESWHAWTQAHHTQGCMRGAQRNRAMVYGMVYRM